MEKWYLDLLACWQGLLGINQPCFAHLSFRCLSYAAVKISNFDSLKAFSPQKVIREFVSQIFESFVLNFCTSLSSCLPDQLRSAAAWVQAGRMAEEPQTMGRCPSITSYDMDFCSNAS